MSTPLLTVADVLGRSTGYLAARGAGTPRLDAELLLAHALGVGRIDLYTDHERPLVRGELERMRDLLGRRGRGQPVAQLLGRRAFRRLSLRVTPDVLTPRPETELVVEWALERARPGDAVCDWGTGTGAIALALADEGPGLHVTGVELSEAALRVARANAGEAGLAVELLASDGLGGVAGRSFDLIVANPPYLSDAELAAGPPELAHEPRGALAAGPRGDEALARLAREAPGHLPPGGHLISEIGAGQADAAAGLWRAAGLRGIEVRADLAGLPRAIAGRLPG